MRMRDWHFVPEEVSSQGPGRLCINMLDAKIAGPEKLRFYILKQTSFVHGGRWIPLPNMTASDFWDIVEHALSRNRVRIVTDEE
jgi:hypothetical protein